MKHQKHPLRLFLFSLLLLCLLTGLTGISRSPRQVEAAPQMQAVYPPGVVISEFRTRGAMGADDEFIEIFNATKDSVNITGWKINKSSACSGVSSPPLVAAVNGNVTLSPGQYYLFAKSSGFSGSADVTYGSSISIADDGGIALLDGANNIIDQVGMCATTFYKEGTSLAKLTADVNQSYERKIAGESRNCSDTNNNAADFVLNSSSSNPQTFSSLAVPCLYVIDVDSPTPDGSYTTLPTTIDIEVTFSGTVFVSGVPTLQLETGVTDRTANYVSGSGTSMLTFTYNAILGDNSPDLDYVSSTALSGAIYDTIGNAILTLPTPGSSNSLAGQNALVISIDDGLNPSVVSIKRQPPASTPTNSNTLTFRVTFSENVNGVDANGSDFTVTGVTTPVIVASPVSGSVYDVAISGGNLDSLNGIVGLDINAPTITDQIGNPLPDAEPVAANDETYLVDNTNPDVTVSRAASQTAATGATPVNFTVVFTEPIVDFEIVDGDVEQLDSPAAITWTISNPSDDRRTFNLIATTVTTTNVVLAPFIDPGSVRDDAGNPNNASTNTNNTVTFTDTTRPTVAISRASGQAANTNALPVRFSVVFSEAINTGTFTPSDITQSATSQPASGISWTISDSGDHRNFTISATVVTVGGNITPSISANRLTDVAGNGNTASTGNDTVQYGPPPTPTITPTRTATPIRTATRTRTPTRVPTVAPPQLVAISEFVPRPGHDWNSDGEVNVQDEYIEVINHGPVSVNLSGYSLDDEVNIGSAPYRLPAVIIQPGERLVFYGSETGLLLSDGGDGVRLLKPNGQLMDAYNYTVARYPDQSYCRLPDDGGLDDWNQNCYPTPGLQNSLSGDFASPATGGNEPLLCPIADTLPDDFVFAECSPYGSNIWRRAFWDATGWYGEKIIPGIQSRWDVFAD